MNRAKPLKRPEQVRQELDRQGRSIADFACVHRNEEGQAGEAHRAAVLLGLKAGIATSVKASA